MHSIDKVSKITVEVREWFQKTYGNTYHKLSVKVEYFGLPAVVLHTKEMVYGGQGHWAHTVGSILLNNGLVPRDPSKTLERQSYGVLHQLQEDGITVSVDVQEVKRKKDL